MLLEELLSQSPESAAVMLRPSAYAEEEQPDLVRDVLALANAAAGEIRHLLLGAEKTSGGVRVLGLDRASLDRCRRLCEELVELIEPTLRVSTCFAELDGKKVAALEISGCDNPPYTLRRRISEDMRTGACWVRDLDDVRPARREDLDRMYARRAAEPRVPVEVGLSTDPACLQMRLDVPEASRPPSLRARQQLLSAMDAKKTANRMLGDDDTGLARLSHARIFGADTPFVQRGMNTLVEQYNQAADEYEAADRHYFYEEHAVKLQLSVRNRQSGVLEGATIEFSLPQVAGFEVADRLYRSPDGDHSITESRLAGYPEVKLSPDRATIRVSLGRLEPGQTQAVFEAPLRIRVGAEMKGMKVAMKYRLSAAGLNESLSGRLKLVFSR